MYNCKYYKILQSSTASLHASVIHCISTCLQLSTASLHASVMQQLPLNISYPLCVFFKMYVKNIWPYHALTQGRINNIWPYHALTQGRINNNYQTPVKIFYTFIVKKNFTNNATELKFYFIKWNGISISKYIIFAHAASVCVGLLRNRKKT